MGITAALPPAVRELDQIELVPLGDRRILVILVTRDRTVHNRVVVLDEAVSSDELINIRNYVNHNFSGWRLEDARRELLQRIAEERAIYDAVLRKLTLLYRKGLLDVDVAPEVHMEGASNLLGLDLHLTREKMRDLLRALEEKEAAGGAARTAFWNSPPDRSKCASGSGGSASGHEGVGASSASRSRCPAGSGPRSPCWAPCACATKR